MNDVERVVFASSEETKTIGIGATLMFVECMAKFGDPFTPDLPHTIAFCELAVSRGYLQKGPGGVPNGPEGYEMTEAGAEFLAKFREENT